MKYAKENVIDIIAFLMYHDITSIYLSNGNSCDGEGKQSSSHKIGLLLRRYLPLHPPSTAYFMSLCAHSQVIRHYHGHLSAVYDLDLHPTIDVLVTCSRDATARVSPHTSTVWHLEYIYIYIYILCVYVCVYVYIYIYICIYMNAKWWWVWVTVKLYCLSFYKQGMCFCGIGA